jgi:hypothetical protein
MCLVLFMEEHRWFSESNFAALEVDIDKPSPANNQGQLPVGIFARDDFDLTWYTPRPSKPRMEGWEDDFMQAFKEAHYNPNQRLRCKEEKSPYRDSHLVCHIPAYIPARLHLSQPQHIPRVIFVSWKTRKLDRGLFTSIKTILNDNPEYELIIFDDFDVDDFVCSSYPELAGDFSRLRVGAQRIDVWRMMVTRLYGGVYLDIDMSSMHHLPINATDDAVTSVGSWTHLPSKNFPGGVLFHWAFAFKAHHPLITTTLEIITENLRNPMNDFVEGSAAKEAESSYTMRLTGPATFQRALNRLLNQSDCRPVNGNYEETLKNPHFYCNMTSFHAIFGNMVVTGHNFDHAVTEKIFTKERESLPNSWHYNDLHFARPLNMSLDGFCSMNALNSRRAEWERLWNESSSKK